MARQGLQDTNDQILSLTEEFELQPFSFSNGGFCLKVPENCHLAPDDKRDFHARNLQCEKAGRKQQSWIYSTTECRGRHAKLFELLLNDLKSKTWTVLLNITQADEYIMKKLPRSGR